MKKYYEKKDVYVCLVCGAEYIDEWEKCPACGGKVRLK